MFRSIEALDQHNIQVFTIKTGALTIKNEDSGLVQQVLDFEPGLGKLRHSKTGQDILVPNKTIRETNNTFNTITTKSNHNSSFKCSRRI